MYKSQLILSYFKDKNVSLTRTIESSEKDIINGVVSKPARELVKMADYLAKVREDKQQFIEKWDGKYPNTVVGDANVLLNIN